MTIQDNGTRDQYTATGVQTVFAYTFEIFDKDDIKVQQKVNLTGITTTLVEGTDYTVSGVGNDNGGNITLIVGTATNDIITLSRDMALERITDYQNSGDFLASTVNDDYDRLWAAVQQNESTANVAIRPTVDDPVLDRSNTELAPPSVRAGKSLAFDADGRLDYISGTLPVGEWRGFTTVTAMISDVNITLGDDLYVEDYKTGNNSGYLFFKAVAALSGADDGGQFIDLTGSGLQAKQIFPAVRSVKSWGVTGDGVTLEDTKLQAAVSANSGGNLHFPDGSYNISVLPTGRQLLQMTGSSKITWPDVQLPLYNSGTYTGGREIAIVAGVIRFYATPVSGPAGWYFLHDEGDNHQPVLLSPVTGSGSSAITLDVNINALGLDETLWTPSGIVVGPDEDLAKEGHSYGASVTTVDFRIEGSVNNISPNLIEFVETATGTHTGANNQSLLTDAARSFTINVLVGKLITNTTDGSSGIITANTATTITATLSGGTDDDWDTSDAYTVTAWEGSSAFTYTWLDDGTTDARLRLSRTGTANFKNTNTTSFEKFPVITPKANKTGNMTIHALLNTVGDDDGSGNTFIDVAFFDIDGVRIQTESDILRFFLLDPFKLPQKVLFNEFPDQFGNIWMVGVFTKKTS